MTGMTNQESQMAAPKAAFTASNISEDYLGQRFSRSASAKQPLAYEATGDAALIHQYQLLAADIYSNPWGGSYVAAPVSGQHVVARRGLQCVAGGVLSISAPRQRQLLPMEKQGLRLAELLPALDLNDTCYGEFSHVAMLPEFLNGDAFAQLIAEVTHQAIEQGAEYIFNIAPVPLAYKYRDMLHDMGIKWGICHDIEVPQRDAYEALSLSLSVIDLSLQLRNKRHSEKSTAKAPVAAE